MTIDAIIDSRQTGGTLTIGAKSFATQSTSVALVPNTSTTSDGDAVVVLSGAELLPSETDTTTWSLDLGLISDFTDPDGLVEWCRAHAGQEQPAVWTPNSLSGPTYGDTTDDGDPLTVRVRPIQIGGEVRSRLNHTVSFPVVGTVPVPTWPGA